MIEDLKELARKKVEGTSPEEVIDFLYKNGAITDKALKRTVIGLKFYDEYGHTPRTARDIEIDLSSRYTDLTAYAVSALRRRFAYVIFNRKKGRV